MQTEVMNTSLTASYMASTDQGCGLEWVASALVPSGSDESPYSLLGPLGFQHNRNPSPSRQVWKFRLSTESFPTPPSQGAQVPHVVLIPWCGLSVKSAWSRIVYDTKYFCFARLLLFLASKLRRASFH